MKWLAAGLFSLSVLTAYAPPSRACGIKLTIKSAPPRTAAARKPDSAKPVRTDQSRDVVAARARRKPIAAGPQHGADHELIAAKPPTPPPPPPTDTTPPPTPPQPAITTSPTPQPETPQTPADTHEVKPLKADSMLAEVYFSVGSSTVGSHASLDRVAKKLAAHADAHVRIEGYADPTGTPEGNMSLSEQRADSVRDYLESKGVDSSRVDVKAFGDTVLKYGRTDGRNRRVAVVVE
jgi:outer membrane protein OmpA-like peptidoglycan-associated protein